MKAFLITVVVALLLLAGGLWYAQQNPDKLPDEVRHTLAVGEDIRPPARGPQDYHMLQDQGGIPLAEAERAGLVTADYGYLSAMPPLKMDEGIEKLSAANCNGKLYDFSYRFNTTRPEEQVLEFNLHGEWDQLVFGFGFSDDEASDPSGTHGIELSVQADGKDLFGPALVSPVTEPIFTQLEVKGVRHLTFISKRVGFENNFAPLLLDPFVKNMPLPADAAE